MYQTEFGACPEGQPVQIFTLGDPEGFHTRITNYGGIVTELHVPDRGGELADVVLGFDSLAPYLDTHPFFGTIVGRIAGRLTNGAFELDGEKYQLAVNDGPNHLHGGLSGFDKRVWDAQVDNEKLVLTYTSPDGEEGYPGTVALKVTYSIEDGTALKIDYRATTDKATPLCLTNHSYFNLSGEGSGEMLDHALQIHSDEYVPMDENATLTGRRVPVEGQPTDYREPTPIRERIDDMFNQHGENYLFPASKNGLTHFARVTDPTSGRVMDVHSDQPCLQLYTGCKLDGTLIGKAGAAYGMFGGLCLECQGYPDAPNQPDFPSSILRPGETYRQTTVYRFSNA